MAKPFLETLWSEEAEQSALGAAILWKGARAKMKQVLRGMDFFRPAHGLIWTALMEMDDLRMGVDLVTLKDYLMIGDGSSNENHVNFLPVVGGVDYLINLCEICPGAANAGDYARIVKDYSQARIVRDTCASAARRINEGGMTAFREVRESLREATSCVSFESRSPFEPETLSDFSTDKAIPFMGPIFKGTVFDIGGLSVGGYSVLAGFRGTGKSLIAIQTCREIAQRGMKALYVSNEMSEKDTWKRRMKLACGMSQCDPFDDGAERFAGVLENEKRLGIGFLDIAGRDMSTALAMIEAEVTQNGYDLVVLDYFQLMLGSGGADFKEQAGAAKKVLDMSKLPAFSDTCLLILSQVTLSDTGQISVRGGKDLENHAQFVGVIRPNKEWNDAHDFREGRGLIIEVTKNRNGLSDLSVKLHRHPHTLEVAEIS